MTLKTTDTVPAAAATNGFLLQTGPIDATTIASCLSSQIGHPSHGALSFFAGQVRADQVKDSRVTAIEYSVYHEMAEAEMHRINMEIQEQFGLCSVLVIHSTGRVETGAICLFVLTAAPHRAAAMQACDRLVERIKTELPVWGKELFANAGYQWKVNH